MRIRSFLALGPTHFNKRAMSVKEILVAEHVEMECQLTILWIFSAITFEAKTHFLGQMCFGGFSHTLLNCESRTLSL